MKSVSEGVARLYAEDRDGRVVLSFKAYLTDAELRLVARELRRLSSAGYLRSYQAGFMRGEPIQDRLMPDGDQVLRYVGGLAQAFGAVSGSPRKPWLGGAPSGDLPEDWDPRSQTWHAIVESFARTIFVLAWAEAMEERGYGLYQVNLNADAPVTPRKARKKAEQFFKDMSKMNGFGPDAMYTQALMRDLRDSSERVKESFGYYLAMEALGHGVSWADHHAPHGLKVPYIEFSGFELEDEDLDLGNWQHRKRGSA